MNNVPSLWIDVLSDNYFLKKIKIEFCEIFKLYKDNEKLMINQINKQIEK